MSAIGRFKSENWLDKIYGALYYSLILMLPINIYFVIKLYENDNGTFLLSMTILTVLFVFANLSTLKDYKKENDTHKGTLDNFISKIKISQPNWLAKNFFSINGIKDASALVKCIFMISVMSTMISVFIGFLLLLTNNNKDILFIGLYAMVLIPFSWVINYNFIGFIKVSPEFVNEIFEIKDITERQRDLMFLSLKAIFSKNESITRDDIFNICTVIKKEKEKNKMKEIVGSKEHRYEEFQKTFKN